MELKILEKKEEPLLSRIMVEGEVSFDKATPSTQEIKESMAKSLGKDGKLIDIKGIYTAFGRKKASVLCYAYDNEDVLKRINVEKKGEVKEEKPKEAAKAEEKREEGKKEAKLEAAAKTEEKKEEKSAEKVEEKAPEVKEEAKPEVKEEKKEEPKPEVKTEAPKAEEKPASN